MLATLAMTADAVRAEVTQTIQAIKPAIVGIGTYQKTRSPSVQFLGTGFVVADGLHVVTNAHVLPSALNSENREVLIILAGTGKNPEPREASTIAIDDNHDLALIKIEGDPLPAVRLGDSGAVREGQSLFFTGYPIGTVLGLHPVTHRSMVSAITPIVLPSLHSKQLDEKMIKRLRAAPYMVFQLDAVAYPGNSGSPLYDPENGKVYGIINMVFVKGTKESALSAPSGISYAIPANFIRDFLKANNLVD
jgi:serine protease Do